jgi:predicted sulfurtransferase
MRFIWILLFCITYQFSFGQGKDIAFDKMLTEYYKNTVPTISAEKLNQLMSQNKPIVLLDTRSGKEYEVSKIKGAIHTGFLSFNYNSIENELKGKTVIVYCTIGARSETVGEKVLNKDTTHTVYNLYGGIVNWKNSGFEVVDGENKPTENVHVYSKSWGKWLKKGTAVY